MFVFFSLIVVCCGLFFSQVSTVISPQLKRLVVPSCLCMLVCFVFYLSVDAVVILLVASLFLSSWCFGASVQRCGAAQLTSVPSGILVVSLLLTQLSAHPFMVLISLELLSISTIILIAELCHDTSRSKFNILTYYWIGAICSMGLCFSLVFYCLQLSGLGQISSDSTLKNTIFTFVVLLLIATKLGALPSGFWAIWFYESIGAGALVTYVSTFYPILLFISFLLLRSFYSLSLFCHSAVSIFVLVVLISTILTLFLNNSSSKRVSTLLVTLTSATFLLILGSLILNI